MQVRRVLILGTTPPPAGGVTSSVANLIRALHDAGVTTLRRPSAVRCDIGHVHYSKPWKRLVGLLVARATARRAVFTLHGNHLDPSDPLNRAACRLAHGAVFLNADAAARYAPLVPASTVLSSLLVEGLRSRPAGSAEDLAPGTRYALFYAYDRLDHDGQDLYGGDFLLGLGDRWPEGWRLVFLDPRGAYPEARGVPHVHYIGHTVDFEALLDQVDLYVRPTATDGSSVAILEALSHGVPVLASDAVPRDPAVHCFRHRDARSFLETFQQAVTGPAQSAALSSVRDYLSFCESLLG